MLTRRALIQSATAVAAAAPAPAAGPLGRVKPRPSLEIKASPISLGFETLDRKQFDPERCYPHVAKLGVKWARCQTGWARTETKRGVYDFSWLDAIVDSLRAIGVEPWFNVGFGNRLYTPGALHESAVGWAPVFTPEARQGWVRYVEKLASHFRGRVTAFEVWNEPNITAFWQPGEPSADSFMELMKITTPVLRRNIPGVKIVAGGFTSLPGVLDYLERAFDLGLADLCDVVSYHPYRAQPEANYANDLRGLRGLIDRYRRGLPLWQGENGAPSFGGGEGALSNLEWSEQSQARWLLRRLLTDLTLGKEMGIELTSYFLVADIVNYIRREGQTGKTNPKGVLRGTDYTPKPSYYALQNLCALFDGETKPADFQFRVEPVQAVAGEAPCCAHPFVRQGKPIYAFWFPSVLQQTFATRPARLSVWSGKGAKLDKPVLVDLLTGEVRQPEKAEARGGFWHLDNVGVTDAPQLLTDASLVV